MNTIPPSPRPSDRWAALARDAGPQDNIAHYLRLLWHGKLLIIATTLVALIATFALLNVITPQYTASSKVMIDPRRNQLFASREVVGQLPSQVVTVMSEVEIIRSRNLTIRVADALDLWNDPLFNPMLRPQPTGWVADLRAGIASAKTTLQKTLPFLGTPTVPVPMTDELARQSVIRGLLGRLTVSPVQQSLVMQISYTSPSPELSRRIADEYANQYVLDQLENKFEAARQAAGWLASRLESLRNAVETSARAVALYRTQNNLMSDAAIQPAQQQLTELNSQLIVVQAKRAELEARIARIRSAVNSTDPATAVELIVDSPLIQRIKEQETQLAREISDLSTRYREQHPRMVKARAELEELRRKLVAEVSRLADSQRSELEINNSREAKLKEQIQKIEATIHVQGQAGIRLNELERELASNRLIYETFLQRAKETSEQEQAQRPEARIISNADTPSGPSSPKRMLFLAADGFIGVVFGAILVLLIDALRNTFVNRDQLEHLTGVPVLSTTPKIGRGGNLSEYLIKKPGSAFAENMRSAWVALKHSGRQETPRVVAITSSLPGEGKSVTALSLARTIALLGNSVAIVDCDLRRSTLSVKAGLKPTRHIGEILTGQATIDDVRIADQVQGLDIYPGVNLPSPPVELFSSQAMHDFIATLRQRYDLVLMDCPPVLPVSDTHLLARLADATVLLVQWNRVPKDAVRSAVRMLDEVGAKIAGTILTQVHVRRQARYGYGDASGYYKQYKSYYKG